MSPGGRRWKGMSAVGVGNGTPMCSVSLVRRNLLKTSGNPGTPRGDRRIQIGSREASARRRTRRAGLWRLLARWCALRCLVLRWFERWPLQGVGPVRPRWSRARPPARSIRCPAPATGNAGRPRFPEGIEVGVCHTGGSRRGRWPRSRADRESTPQPPLHRPGTGVDRAHEDFAGTTGVFAS